MTIKEFALSIILIAALTIAPAAHADAAISPIKSCKGHVTIIKGKAYCVAPPFIKPPKK